MSERLPRIAHTFTKSRHIPGLSSLSAYLRTLPAGDKLIALILGAVVCISALFGMHAALRTVLVSVPSYGGTLAEGILGSPRFVNPLLAISDADKDMTALVYAGLMGKSNGELVPVLAESYTVSEDGTEYTFTLREGLTFHNGMPVTAEDVVFTIQKAQDPALKSPELSNWANVRVTAHDARTVSFTLPKEYPSFLENATLGILPARVWSTITNEEFPFSPLQEEPIGAGPFKVGSIERSKTGVIEEYVLTAFKEYALKRPYLERLVITFFAKENDLIRAHTRGRVESAYGIPETDALRVPYSRVFGVFFNANQNPLYARAEVREALSLALDREQLISDVLGGYATPLTGPVPPGSGVDVTFYPETREERLHHAREALLDSDWEQTETGWVHEDAGPLTLTLKTSNLPELKAVAQEIKTQWEAFGVPVALELYEAGDLTASVIRPRRFEALLFGMVVESDTDLFAFWSSSERNDPGLNVSMYANRTVDVLLEEIRETTSDHVRETRLAELNEIISGEYPAAFLYAPDFVYTLPKDLRGVSIPQVASPADRFSGVHAWYRHTEAVWPFFIRE